MKHGKSKRNWNNYARQYTVEIIREGEKGKENWGAQKVKKGTCKSIHETNQTILRPICRAVRFQDLYSCSKSRL